MSVHAQNHVSPHQLPGRLIRVLRRHADERPRQPAFVHLLDGQGDHASLTYAQLDRRARAIAARLQDMGFAGQFVLLVYPPGLD
ncbi:MAG: AMP-dependent synthetase, partial [Terriglobia bacterium]